MHTQIKSNLPQIQKKEQQLIRSMKKLHPVIQKAQKITNTQNIVNMRLSSYSFNSTTSTTISTNNELQQQNQQENIQLKNPLRKNSNIQKNQEIIFQKLKDEKLDAEKALLNFNLSFENSDDDENIEQKIQKSPQKDKKNELLQKQQTLEILDQQQIINQTGNNDLQEINILVLREKNLLFFKNTEKLDLSLLNNLEYLSLTHNYISNIEGISSIPNINLLEINLEYNNIIDISPIYHHIQLKKLYLSQNQIQSIKGLYVLKNLQTLTLSNNKIKDLNETLNELALLPNLKELELDQNPLSKRFNYKYDILWTLILEKIDGETITQVDFDLSSAFRKEKIATYLQISNLNGSQMPQQYINNIKRPQTASYKDRFAKKIGDLVHQSDLLLSIPEDKYQEIENDIENEKNTLLYLEEVLEAIIYENLNLKKDFENIKEENEDIQKELLNIKKIKEENENLNNKLNKYLLLMEKDNKQANFIKQIFLLNLEIYEQEEKIQKNPIQNTSFSDLDENNTKNDNICLDIGFESDDLDEETKELKKILDQNSENINQIKKQLIKNENEKDNIL
ncbi:leucine rich repeat protein [Ichthyophthirius multifiliis]|uniref:Leucine rich repeat protein n=1 Tax=Ichthyophthirius multifiliis TaxID=5932 RepID=G0QVM3_ICHMU|nr:leucine rich repeat protein [Ichthyophthirius multifiliis]EGR30746.1 leucine rich repeat protein [Ichthyophthirius multifiliis]|eukprot:XP_004032333.1 leucine rich repeat protein [Ichthyophthirius multifiliis]